MKTVLFAAVSTVAAVVALARDEYRLPFDANKAGGGGDIHVVEHVGNLVDFSDVASPRKTEQGMVCCLAAMTNSASGGPSQWYAYCGEKLGWRRLCGEVEPIESRDYIMRFELDFSGAESKVRYSVARLGEGDGKCKILRDEDGNEWIPSPTPDKKTYSTFVYD